VNVQRAFARGPGNQWGQLIAGVGDAVAVVDDGAVAVAAGGGPQHRPPLRIGGQLLDALADLVVQGGDPRRPRVLAASRCPGLSCGRRLLLLLPV
jgi:hypothetical protein